MTRTNTRIEELPFRRRKARVGRVFVVPNDRGLRSGTGDATTGYARLASVYPFRNAYATSGSS